MFVVGRLPRTRVCCVELVTRWNLQTSRIFCIALCGRWCACVRGDCSDRRWCSFYGTTHGAAWGVGGGGARRMNRWRQLWTSVSITTVYSLQKRQIVSGKTSSKNMFKDAANSWRTICLGGQIESNFVSNAPPRPPPSFRKSIAFWKVRQFLPLVRAGGIWNYVCSTGWITLTGGKQKYSEKTLYHCHFSHHKSYKDWPGIEPSLRCDRPATSRLLKSDFNLNYI